MAELDREPCGSRGVAARPSEAVAALMRLDRGLRIELVAGGQTRPLERLRRLLLRKRVREPYPRLGPCAARERHTPVLDRSIRLVRSRGRNHSPDRLHPRVRATRKATAGAIEIGALVHELDLDPRASIHSPYRRCRSARDGRVSAGARSHPLGTSTRSAPGARSAPAPVLHLWTTGSWPSCDRWPLRQRAV